MDQDKITAALRKLGPISPGELADHLGVSREALATPLKAMLDAGAVKATGVTKSRRIALPDQKFESTRSAPPQQRRKQHKRRRHGKAKRPQRAPRTTRPAATERFIPAMDAENGLVIVNGGEPVIFTPAQTQDIATLLLQHFKA